MKSEDPLLAAWDKVLARKGDAPAVFDTRGNVIRTFFEVDKHAREIEAKTKPHNLNAIRIGNHVNWPSLFLACMRKQNIVLPIDESLSRQQADAAVSTKNRRISSS